MTSGLFPSLSGRLLNVDSQPRALFLFGDGGLDVEPNIDCASGYMEPVDVRNGEYEAVFDESGRRYRFDVVNGATQLLPTDEFDVDALKERLRAHALETHSLEGFDPDDPMAAAAAISRFEWEHRWPRWPKWLSQRLHGSQPEIVA